MSGTLALEQAILGHTLAFAPMVATAQVYVALDLAPPAVSPSEAAPGTEATGAGYTRMPATFALIATPANIAANTAVIEFPMAVAAWGTIGYFELWDAAVGGNRLYWGQLIDPATELPTTVTVGSGDILRFSPGALAVQAATGTGGTGTVGAYLPLGGGTLSGPLLLAADPTTYLQAATKQYVDAHSGTGGGPGFLPLSGGTMLGQLTLAADPTSALQATTKQYVDGQIASSGVSSFNTRTGAVTLSNSDVTTALTFTPYNATNPSGYQTAAQVTAAVAPAFNGIGRNRLHNSGFSINQRAYVSGTALAAAAYGHDRWKAGSSGCTYTFTQAQPFTTITITAGSLQQIVEAMNVEGGTYTLSWTGTALGRVNAGSYAVSPVAVSGLAVNTAITVEFNAGTLGRIQLEIGSVATPPEKPDPRYDLANCQRFYVNGGTFVLGGASVNGITHYAPFVFPVQMRVTPTMNYSGAGGTGYSAVGVAQNGSLGFSATVTPTGPDFGVSYTWNASADL